MGSVIDSDALVAELVRHQRRIYIFIASLLPNPADVEDVYQQTCMALWKKRDELGDVRDFFSFACGFARNEALHQLRRNARKGAVQLNERLVSTLADEFERDAEPEAYIEALGGCLAKLQAKQRDLLQRRYTGLETVKEIASDLRVSTAALTMRLQRIRHALIKCVENTLAAEGDA